MTLQSSKQIAASGARFRCALFTAVRNEAPFMLEWIAYHKVIGVDKIVIVSNDCTDGTTELLDALHDAGEIIHVSQTVGPDQRAQGQAARIANQQGLLNDAEWAIWLDADEFLNIHVGDGHVDDLIEYIGARQGIFLHWKLFGDSGNKRFGGRFIASDYTHASPNEAYFHLNLKTFFRSEKGKKFLHKTVHRPRLKPNAYGLDDFLTGDGVPLSVLASDEPKETDVNEFWFINQQWLDGGNSHKVGIKRKGSFGHSIAQINHYAVRTPEFYALKTRRGRGFALGGATAVNDRHNDKYYQRHNGFGAIDPSILRHEAAVTLEIARLRESEAVKRAEDFVRDTVAKHLRSVPSEEIAAYESLSVATQETFGLRIGQRAGSSLRLPVTFDELAEAITVELCARKLSSFVVKTWVYQDKCLVVGFKIFGVRFAMDFTPEADGSVSCDMVNRSAPNNEPRYQLIPSGKQKERIADKSSINETIRIAMDMVYKVARDVRLQANHARV